MLVDEIAKLKSLVLAHEAVLSELRFPVDETLPQYSISYYANVSYDGVSLSKLYDGNGNLISDSNYQGCIDKAKIVISNYNPQLLLGLVVEKVVSSFKKA